MSQENKSQKLNSAAEVARCEDQQVMAGEVRDSESQKAGDTQ